MLALVSFVPFVAVRYRRSGRLTIGDLAALVALPVYGLALWTYTLLPLPDPGYECKEPETAPFAFMEVMLATPARSMVDILRNAIFLQVVLNVALFVPLGVLLRWRAHRGLVVAALFGFGTSLMIELTQGTGIWGVYECAYRLFSVDDLIANTLGAVTGSLLAWLVLDKRDLGAEGPDRAIVAQRPGRRIMAMVCDVAVIGIVGGLVAMAWRVWQGNIVGVLPYRLDLTFQRSLQWGVPFALEAVWVLGRGRTIGEAAVMLDTEVEGEGSITLRRMVKLMAGIGVFCFLSAWDSWVAVPLMLAYLWVSVAAATRLPDNRGLANHLAGLRPVAAATRPGPRSPSSQRSDP